MSAVDKWLGKPCNDPTCTGHQGNTKSFSEWWTVCTDCGQFFFAYEPMPHQRRFHRDPAKFKLFAGGRKSQSPLKTIQIRGNSKGIA